MSWRPGYGIRRVGVDEVESVVEDPTVLIIDVREEDRDYGYGHIHEATVQLWGRGGGRQVRDARTCIVSNGGYGYGAMILRRD